MGVGQVFTHHTCSPPQTSTHSELGGVAIHREVLLYGLLPGYYPALYVSSLRFLWNPEAALLAGCMGTAVGLL